MNRVENKYIIQFTDSSRQKNGVEAVAQFFGVKENQNLMHSISLITLNEGSKDLIDDPVLSLVPGMLQANPVYRGSQDDDIFYSFINRIVIKPYSGLGSQDLMDQLKGYDAVIKQNEYDSSVYEIVFNRPFEKVLSIANNLFEKGICEFAEPDLLMFGKLTQSDPTNDLYSHQQWAIKNTGQYGFSIDADMDIKEAWSITNGGSGIKVGILDSGVDLNHEDLTGKFNAGQDFTGMGYGGGFYEYYVGDSAVSNAHGTAVASVICGIKNNQKGIAGAANQVKFNSGKIIYAEDFQTEVTQASWVANGINWAKGNSDIINMSFWITDSINLVYNAISSAVTSGRNNKGCILTSATGNNGSSIICFPASNPNVIAVGATTPCDRRPEAHEYCGIDVQHPNQQVQVPYSSDIGEGMDVVAPGTWIVTADITDARGWNMIDPVPEHERTTNRFGLSQDLKYTVLNGTSFSAPDTASVAALILSINPTLTQSQVRDIIETTTDTVGGYTGLYRYIPGAGERPGVKWSIAMGYGRINAKKALNAVTTGLNGPANVCPQGSIYSITFYGINPSNVTWTSSTNIILSGSGSSRTAIPSNPASSDENGWIKAKVNGASSWVKKNVKVGKFIDGTVLTNGQTISLYSTCLVYPGQFIVTPTKPVGATDYSWNLTPGHAFPPYPSQWQQQDEKLYVTLSYGQTAYFNVSANTAECGTIYRDNIIFVAVMGGYGYTIYPNPSDNEINVAVNLENNLEIPAEALKGIEIRMYDSNERPVKTIYNKEGFKTITFSTTDLKPGLYIINIINGDDITHDQVIIK